jgi:ribonuclease E
MLIDASHPEETRVVVLDGQKVEEFDFEAATKRPLKGNIYLAKVTRVEPSLQAAFVEYGGNRQGFLAFSEIHPDYYQIPVADRIALLADQEAEARRRQEDDIESFEITSKHGSSGAASETAAVDSEEIVESEETEESQASQGQQESDESPEEPSSDDEESDDEEEVTVHQGSAEQSEDDQEDLFAGQPDQTDDDRRSFDEQASSDNGSEDGESQSQEPATEGAPVQQESSPQSLIETPPAQPGDVGETAQSAQTLEAQRPSQRWMRRRHYKIQEVIKRRQIILVQVVKEERGNKGAALTTYLSLAGRYCVLMPNTPRGGGISRKITNANDRKRLKSAAQALDLPEGMGLIIRTAGENRTKVEIKRDYEYLLRMWDTIRELTLKSNAPACVYEEGDLIKRAIRDLYNKDVTEVLVEGEDGYRNAKDFMRMLMPSHAKNVKPFKDAIPLFQRFHIEAQLDAMFSPTVTLKSGGYIVINQTEALVSIDVNSGRATREHSIEETATKTNLEAADEVGRQLRLRDLAGLIVIDFIDMEDGRNDRAVEKRLHNAVKNDRARVQIGKISQFGLLEMSRQRLRAGVIAGSTVPCPHCGGQGIVRSVESTSLRVLRGLEEEAQKQRAEGLLVRVASEVAIYTLNQKRRELARLETEYDITVTFEPKDDLMAGNFDIERIGQRDPESRPRPAALIEAAVVEVEAEVEPVEEEIEETEEAPRDEARGRDETRGEALADGQPSNQPAGEGGRRKRRRRRRGGRDRERPFNPNDQHREPQPLASNSEPAAPVAVEQIAPAASGEFTPVASNGAQFAEGRPSEQQGPAGEGVRRRRRRRRGRRGGRDRENFNGEQRADNAAPQFAPAPLDRFGQPDEIDTTPREEPRIAPSIAVPNASSTPVWSLKADSADQPAPKPKPADLRPQEPASSETAPPAAPVKKGWWQRAFKSD